MLANREVQHVLDSLTRPDIAGVIVSSLDRLIRPGELGDLRIFDAFQRSGKLIFTPAQSIDLRTDEAGTRLSVVEGGLVRHQTPVTPIPAEVCEAYTGAVASLGRDRVLRECNGRFTAENCTSCLTP